MNSAKQIAEALSRRPSKRIELIPDGFRRAAVMIICFPGAHGAELILTRRTELVNSHKGQVAFPGGATDDGDQGPEETAIRETWEEIGITPGQIAILGYLDDRPTISDFLVTPVIGWMNAIDENCMNQTNDEIARVFSVPISWLANPDNVRVERWERRGFSVRMYQWHWQEEIIWGMTGMVIAELLDCLLGKPVFASLPEQPSTMEDFLKSVSR